MHYFYKTSLMTDVMATCGLKYHSSKGEWICYLKNDGVKDFAGTVTLLAYSYMGNGTATTLYHEDVNVQAGLVIHAHTTHTAHTARTHTRTHRTAHLPGYARGNGSDPPPHHHWTHARHDPLPVCFSRDYKADVHCSI